MNIILSYPPPEESVLVGWLWSPACEGFGVVVGAWRPGCLPVPLHVDEEKEKQYEVEWSTDPVVENVATTAETPLTIHTITSLTYPTGATEVRVILLPMIKASAQVAATHHIGIKILYEVNDGGWNTLKDFTANPPMSLAGDGAVDSWAYPIDISAIVSSGDKLELRFTVTSDNAGSVNYTTSFLVVLVYKMG